LAVLYRSKIIIEKIVVSKVTIASISIGSQSGRYPENFAVASLWASVLKYEYIQAEKRDRFNSRPNTAIDVRNFFIAIIR
jgi:hypothetical protein